MTAPRALLLLGLLLAAAPPAGAAPRQRLRVLHLNTHSFQEPDPVEKLHRIGRKIAELKPDLVSLCEVMKGGRLSCDATREILAGVRQVDPSLQYHIHEKGFGTWGSGERMHNCMLSRGRLSDYDVAPLTTTTQWPAPSGERRNALYARSEGAAVGPVHFFVTHPWGFDSRDTPVQLDELRGFIARKATAAALTVIAGDFNQPSTSPALRRLGGELVDTWARANPGALHKPTTPWDRAFTPARLDYILVKEDAALRAALWDWTTRATS